MPGALIAMNLAIKNKKTKKKLLRLNALELKIGFLTENMIHLLIGRNKQILASVEYNGSQGFVATVERKSIGLGIAFPRGTHKVTSCHVVNEQRGLSARGPNKQLEQSSLGQPRGSGQSGKSELRISSRI